MKPLVPAALLGILPAVCAQEPMPPTPVLLPQPVLLVQQSGQLAITDRNPQPVVIIQNQGQLLVTSTGEALMPLNAAKQQKEDR